jgi:OmpA-OmpF porin, OOP family
MFSNFNKSLIAVTLAVGGVASAQAEGLYVGGSLGAPRYSSSVNGIGGDDGGTAVKLYGGYQLTPNIAVEGGYFDLGHSDDASGRAKARGLYADAVGSYTVAPQWAVLGSAGLAEGRFTTTRGDDNSPALKLGAGVQYELTPMAALRVQYDRYHFVSAFGSKPNIGALSAGVKVAF